MSNQRPKRKQNQRQNQKPSPSKDDPYPQYDSSKDEKWNKPAINAARDLFLQNYPYERIFMLTGLPTSIWYRKQKTWLRMRERLQLKQMKDLQRKSISRQMEDIIRLGGEFGSRYLRRILADPASQHMEPKDFRAVMQTVLDMHKVKQLEEGAPTDIKGVYDHMNLDQMREYMTSMAVEMQKEYGEVIDYVEVEAIPVEEQLKQIEFKKEGLIVEHSEGERAVSSDSSSD